MPRQTGEFRLESLQIVPGNAELVASRAVRRDREPALRIGDVVRHVVGGAKMLVVDFVDTFDSPGVELDPDGVWQPLAPIASQLVTVAWRNSHGQMAEDELYRECIERTDCCA